MAQENADLAARRTELRFGSRTLHGPTREQDWVELTRVASYCEANGIRADSYGEGADLQAFEERVAAMLGYPSARFMPSGTMAQQIAIRLWSDQAGITVFGMHPTCHLELHEELAYRHLHGLQATLIGEAHRPISAADFESAVEPMSALIVELPTRENGGQLAPWDDLVALTGAARDRGIATHLDGARLWEAAAGYDKPLNEICGLFDSAYVSFYKGIGALPGSMLAGPEDFISQAVLWQRRHGGNVFNSMANWVSADMRLDAQLAKMAAWRDRAREVAAALNRVDGVTVNPEVPQVNMFHVYLQGRAEDLLVARDKVAEQQDLWLFGELAATDVEGRHRFELAVGDAAQRLELPEITYAFETLLAMAQ